jgi:hypothetical protein
VDDMWDLRCSCSCPSDVDVKRGALQAVSGRWLIPNRHGVALILTIQHEVVAIRGRSATLSPRGVDELQISPSILELHPIVSSS